MTTSSTNYFELENQFILRLPTVKENGLVKPHPASLKLREALAKKNLSIEQTTDGVVSSEPVDTLKDRLFIELNTETRKGRVKFDEEIFDARLVDLPCIIESLKTVDKKMFYKIADICQMLICKTKEDPWHTSDEEDAAKKKDSKAKKPSDVVDKNTNLLKKYQWPHGIAPPLKNVRRKRFRKVAKKKIIDYAEIEKEVKQLFRSDREAYKVEYEVVLVEGELDEHNNEANKNGDRNTSLNMDDDYENSSQEDGMGGIADGNSCMDSAIDNESNKPGNSVTLMKRSAKAKKLIEESNMSSAMEDDDSMVVPSTSGNKKFPETDVEDGETTNLNTANFDECSMDNSNKDVKQRTGFKNLFNVEEVLGDLSSSSDEDEDNNDESTDEEDKKTKNKSIKSFKFNLNKNSVHMTTPGHADESMSNFDDSNIGFAHAYDSDVSNLENTSKSTKNVFKEFDLSEDEDNREILIQDRTTYATSTIRKANEDDFKKFGSSLSSSPASSADESKANKAELNTKLNKLMDELQKLKDDRNKREIEINNINNPVLKAHLTSRLNNLIDEELRKNNEINELRALLSNE